jgi:hypothetical protein
MRLDCSGKGEDGDGNFTFDIDRTAPDFTRAWAVEFVPPPKAEGRIVCFAAAATGEDAATPQTPIERAAMQAIERPGPDALRQAYQQCAVHDTLDSQNFLDPAGLGDIDVARSMLILCPEHPEAAVIRERLKAEESGDSGYSPPNPPDTTPAPDDGSETNCVDAVTFLMESLYGSLQSGSWPEGEYTERVAVCEEGH